MHDQDEVAVRGVVESRREQVPHLARVGAREREPGGEEGGEVQGSADAEGGGYEPGSGDGPRPPETPCGGGGDGCFSKEFGTARCPRRACPVYRPILNVCLDSPRRGASRHHVPPL